MKILMKSKSLLLFISGIIFGTSVAFYFNFYGNLGYRYGRRNNHMQWEDMKKNVNRLVNTANQSEYAKVSVTTTNDIMQPHPEQGSDFTVAKVDNSTAIDLYKNVRILCWVMTSPATLNEKAGAVRDTWSKRCNIRLFMSSVENKEFPAVGLPVKEGRDQLYEKTKAAFKYVWEHYRDQADWFMKADDDTYVIVENLRFLLKDYDTNSPKYFGKIHNVLVKQGFMSGGAGYVLSKEALKRFMEGIDSKKCPKGGALEDVEIGKCLYDIGVKAVDTRDDSNRERFYHGNPSTHLARCFGPECIPHYIISFHYVSPQEMYIFDYMIYNVKTYGVSYLYPKLDNSKSNRTD